MRAGLGADTYIDGVATGIGGALLGVNQTVKFATLACESGPGIRLFDNLNYLRSFNRTLAGASGGGYPTVSAEGSSQAAMLCGYTRGGGGVQLLDGGPFGTDFMPRVKATGFDGPAAQSMFELTADGESVATAVAVEYEEDSTRARHFTGDGEFTDLYLVNPRRGTAVTVRDDADGLVDDEGELVEHDGLLPGAHIYLHHDAVGAVTGSMRNDATESAMPWGDGTGDYVTPVALYELEGLMLKHGVGVVGGDALTTTTSNPEEQPPAEDPPGYEGEPSPEEEDESTANAASGECCFVDSSPASASEISTPNNGHGFDPHSGIMLSNNVVDFWDQDSECTVCVHSNSRTGKEGAGLQEGHAWVTLWCPSWGENTSRQNLRTYGTSASGGAGAKCVTKLPAGGGFQENNEKGRDTYGYGIGHYYHCKKVTNRQLLAFLQIIDKYKELNKTDDAWKVTNNCAGFAGEAARAAGINVWGSVPRGISNTISDANGKRPKSDLNPFGLRGDWAGGLEKPLEGHSNPAGPNALPSGNLPLPGGGGGGGGYY